jgi:hypothetical protein
MAKITLSIPEIETEASSCFASVMRRNIPLNERRVTLA